MASGMKRWAGLTALGIAVAAAGLLPPRGEETARAVFGGPGPRLLTPARDRFAALEARVGMANLILKRLQTEDSLQTRLGHLHASGAELVVEAPGGEGVPAYRARLEKELDALGRPAQAVLGRFVVSRDYGGAPARTPMVDWLEIYAGTLGDGSPYCMEVDRLVAPNPRWVSAVLAEPDPLGPCRFWAAYGPPGPRIRTWIEENGYALMIRRGVLGPGLASRRRGVLRNAPGASVISWYGTSIPAERCVHGDRDACAALLEEPGDAARDYVRAGVGAPPRHGSPYRAWVEELAARTGVQPGPSDLLLEAPPMGRAGVRAVLATFVSDLEAREGREAFQRFWSSKEPFAAAFRDAFGEDPGSWVQRWLAAYYREESVGPRVGLAEGGLSLLAVLAAATVGVLVQGRRRIA